MYSRGWYVSCSITVLRAALEALLLDSRGRVQHNCCTSFAVKCRGRNPANENEMPTTAVNRCGGLSQLYAVLVAGCFVQASSASFLHAIAGVLVGGVLGRISNKPRQHQLPSKGATSAPPRRRLPSAPSSAEPPSANEERLFETEGWEGEADVSDWEPFRLLGRSMVDYIANYYEQVEARPVRACVEPGYLKKILKASEFPSRGEKWTDIMADVESFVMPGVTHWQHPRFFAYFPAHSSPPAILGDMLASMFNVIGFSWEASPASTELEIVVLDQLARAVGLPDVFLSDGEGGGVIQGSASEGTLVGLLAARTRALRYMRRVSPGVSDHELIAKMTIYTSDQAHSSVQKAANIAGLGGNVRLVPTRGGDGAAEDDGYALDAADLAAAMGEDVAAGLTPVFVNANVGSTNSCAIDPVVAIGETCRSFSGKVRAKGAQHGQEEAAGGLVPWLHVDAAYAGSAAVCPENRWILDGIEAADSVLFNLHKWLLVNFDCTAMWVKNSAYLVDALSVTPEILKSKEYRRGQVSDFRDWQVPLGRKFRSLKIWLTMRAFGLDKVRGLVRSQTELARDFEAMVKTDERFEIIAPARFGLVCFRLKATDAANEELRSRIIASGISFFSSTKLGGQTCLRMCVGCPSTNIGHVQELWDALGRTADAVAAEGF